MGEFTSFKTNVTEAGQSWKDRMLVKGGASCQTFLLTLGVAAAALLSGCDNAESEAKAEALVLQDVAAYWGVRGQDTEGNHYIRPVIRFRVQNTGEASVGYIQVMAVFRRESFPDEPWGSDFLYSIAEEPIPPGESSEIVTLRSDASFISKDAPEQMFDNPKWEEVELEVFLRVGASSWHPAVELVVPKRIGAPGLEKFLEADPDDPVFPEPPPGELPEIP